MACYLPLDRGAPPAEAEVSWGRLETRAVGDDDWPLVAEAWHLAMRGEMPLCMWHERLHGRIAARVVDDVRRGGDGPVVPDACRLAILHVEREKDGAIERSATPVGAALVTRNEHTWDLPEEVAETDPPVLDWIFVHWMFREHGIAGRLLGEACQTLRAAGHRYLASNALLSSPGSVGLHWGRGFVPCGGMMSAARRHAGRPRRP